MKKHLSFSFLARTFLAVSLFSLSLIEPSYAQHIIPKLGGNLTSVVVSGDYDGMKNRAGFVGGLAFDLPLKGGFSIQPELLFHQKGFKGKGVITEDDGSGSIVIGTFDQAMKFNYIELPILVKFSLKKIYFNFGPYLAYGIGGAYKLKFEDGLEESGKIKFKKSDGYENQFTDHTISFDNALDYGLAIGGGIKIYKELFVDLRYSYGFGNLNDKDPSIGFTKNKSQNRSLQITIGYAFKL